MDIGGAEVVSDRLVPESSGESTTIQALCIVFNSCVNVLFIVAIWNW